MIEVFEIKNMRNITDIFIHCSAGCGDIDSVRRYWKETLGWKSPGYHRFINTDGTVECVAPYEDIVNGVKYYNSRSIHICYQGGVNPDNIHEAMDTRTPEQKEALNCEIENVLNFLNQYQDISSIRIRGHRDVSPDKNLNGRVDPEERIKECPSFDAIPEYQHLIP